MSFSPKNPQAIANELSVQNGFKEIVWQGKLGGFSSVNEKIFADGKTYVLKLTSLARKPYVERLINAAIFLSKKGIPVSIPVTTQAQLCLVTPFIKGDILHEANLDQSALSSAAQLLAKLHKAASPYTSQLSSGYKFLRPVSDIKDEAKSILSSIHIQKTP